ncbi:hypothetical protein FD46_GL000078 [Liquorilactobacillus oeni DSM 19972]|uniref:Uncharacterized protein n=1 Tax=Liquorilactobacillus oeni DSM 19972 TaxID=1423777 RepID=A0A0R1MI55_9LACO|nr:hypothetical protein FD46_GL000078 [Liquorilactobacillus oeni DSM 19972]
MTVLLLFLVIFKKLGCGDLYYFLFIMFGFGLTATLFICLVASLSAFILNFSSLKKEIPFIPYLSSGLFLFFIAQQNFSFQFS